MTDDEFLLNVSFLRTRTVDKQHLTQFERLKNKGLITGTQPKGLGEGYFIDLHITKSGFQWLKSTGNIGNSSEEVDGILKAVEMAFKGNLSDIPQHHIFFLEAENLATLEGNGRGGFVVTLTNDGLRLL